MVIGPYLRERRSAKQAASAGVRAPEARLEEAKGLTSAIGLAVSEAGIVFLNTVTPATYVGKGKVEEIGALVRTNEAALVIMDCALSPVQQRNLERAWNAKVLDRTGLILEIFGQRARTREGSLQVEHAHLNYQKSRLVRSWTHLERQRGGFGFLGGPGETQLESDRRIIQERIARIERDLDGVKRTRRLQRDSRKRVPYPIIALVGYTNAGKSTLFNRLTDESVLSADMLFATLDPTLRAIKLPHGIKAILSDTVGFISDLPTTLIAAFRATLEEVIEADVILHVRDVSHENAQAQSHDVELVLTQLGINPQSPHILEVWNKIDLIQADRRDELRNLAARSENAPALASAINGDGIADLRRRIVTRLRANRVGFDVTLEPGDGGSLSWLHRNTEIIAQTLAPDERMNIAIEVAPEKAEMIKNRFPNAVKRETAI